MLSVEALVEFIQLNIVKSSEPRITADSRLFDDGLIDSVNILNLIGYVEKTIGRRLNDNELIFTNFATPKDIVAHYAKP